MVKRETYQWNSFCSNVGKQVTFLPPVFAVHSTVQSCNVKTSLVKKPGIFFVINTYSNYESE